METETTGPFVCKPNSERFWQTTGPPIPCPRRRRRSRCPCDLPRNICAPWDAASSPRVPAEIAACAIVGDACLQPTFRSTWLNCTQPKLACLLNSFFLPMPDHVVRVAALGDLHCTKTSQGAFQPLFARVAEAAELLLIAGDLTDYGLPDEARVLAKELTGAAHSSRGASGQPRLRVGQAERGAADHLRTPASSSSTATRASCTASASPGVKGFGGGFGKRALGPWGETIIKQFVREAVDEALKLEAALARLRTKQISSRCCTTRRSSRRSKASRSKSIRSWVPAASRSRSAAIPCRSCLTVTRIAASSRAQR